MKVFTLRKRASAMALGIALATGAVTVTGAFGTATPAHAQDAEYSKEWREAFVPLNEKITADGANVASFQNEIQQVLALTKSGDEQLQTGQMLYNAGIKGGDMAMRRQGMEMMIASNKVPATALGQYNFIAYQLTKEAGELTKSRTYLMRAIDLNFTSPQISAINLKLLLAEAYFSEKMFREGMASIRDVITAQKAAGLPVDERWYRRAVGMGVNNQVVPEVYAFTADWVSEFPSEANWRDAINLTRQLNEFEPPEVLDILRLSKEVGTLTDKQDVIYYVEVADARRLPLEVKNLIEGAYADSTATRDDIYLSDQLGVANSRISGDRASLPELEAEADGTSSDTVIVMAAGDAFYSYGEYAKAERFFSKVLGMPGAKTQVALTRLGMSQIAQGKIEEAKATLSKVEGIRAPIASLWMAYANEQRAGG